MQEINVKKRNGRLEPLNIGKINRCVERAVEGVAQVSASEVILDAQMKFYDKIKTSEIDTALILSARSKIEKEPNYSRVAARLLLNAIYKEVFNEGVDHDAFEMQYRKAFITNLRTLVKDGRIDAELLGFDLKKIAAALRIDRDEQWEYIGIQTIYDRYLLHIKGRRMESPQGFLMRVAMGIALAEKTEERTEWAIKFYDLLSSFRYMSSTPTLFNAGTTHSQLSSCYLLTQEDSIDGIFGTIHQQARLSKFAGGLGFDSTPIRSHNAYIKGTNGKSQGAVPFLKVTNDQLVSVNQGGKRKGAGCSYLETFHGDIEEFIELRKNTGDDRRRTHDMNTANWIPDLFMEKAIADEDWWLFSPHETNLHELYGDAFRAEYERCVQLAQEGKIWGQKAEGGAKGLAKRMLVQVFETGHPWWTFKDPSNLRYSNQHCGVVHSSNLCTEILLHTIPTKYDSRWGEVVEYGETAVCNLGSLNLAAYVVDGTKQLDIARLEADIRLAVRMLDNVIDVNYYPSREAYNANMRHRPVGLGVMGTHDALHKIGVDYDSREAVAFCGDAQEVISYFAIQTSAELAAERGKYQTYEGSLWSKNIFPIDTYISLMDYRKTPVTDKAAVRKGSGLLDWDRLRELVKTNGMRNSNVMAIAPTATISYIVGCSQSIEPDFSLLYVYSTLSGEFPMVNRFFVEDMKKRGLWGADLLNALKTLDGDIAATNLPEEVKSRYKTAFQIDYRNLTDAAAARQKWIDQGQSYNLYSDKTSLKYLFDMYAYAWKSGLKTTYYLRTKSASRVEKSTIEKGQTNSFTGSAATPIIVPAPDVQREFAELKQAAQDLEAAAEKARESVDLEAVELDTSNLPMCSIEAMRRGEVCESCQ